MSELTALSLMLRREIIRFTRKPNRTILPSIISTFLYIFAFGYALGSAIPTMGGFSYIEFMLPGLVMMQVILHAYINPAYSLFSSRNDKYIEDPMTTPMRYSTMVVSYVLGGMVRGLTIGLIIAFSTMVLFHIWIYDIPLFILFLTITPAIFASIGVLLGLWAKNIEDVGNIMSYVLSPLLFLGGVFFPISIVPAEWIRWISWLDPMTYIINGFRYAMLGGAQGTDPYICLIAIIVSLALCFYVSLKIFESGYNLKT